MGYFLPCESMRLQNCPESLCLMTRFIMISVIKAFKNSKSLDFEELRLKICSEIYRVNFIKIIKVCGKILELDNII